MSYGIETKLSLFYEESVERVKDALKEEGFGVLTTIDVRDTLKQKLNQDFREVCHPGGVQSSTGSPGASG